MTAAAQYRNFDRSKVPQVASVAWRMETPRDETAERPDKMDSGFWPRRRDYDTAAAYQAERLKAQERMRAWEADDWEYVGVIAVAQISIPIGGGSFVHHEMRSAGLWGIESDAGEYLAETFEEEKRELLRQLHTLADALKAGELA